jgi:hypothetical protein
LVQSTKHQWPSGWWQWSREGKDVQGLLVRIFVGNVEQVPESKVASDYEVSSETPLLGASALTSSQLKKALLAATS